MSRSMNRTWLSTTSWVKMYGRPKRLRPGMKFAVDPADLPEHPLSTVGLLSAMSRGCLLVEGSSENSPLPTPTPPSRRPASNSASDVVADTAALRKAWGETAVRWPSW